MMFARRGRRMAVTAIAAFLVLLLATQTGRAAGFETPPTASAGEILGDEVGGPNYYVDDVVRSDGFLQVFTLVTDYGRFTVQGRALLDRRLDELRAIAAIEARAADGRLPIGLRRSVHQLCTRRAPDPGLPSSRCRDRGYDRP